jgi:hypothetical protein
MHTHWSGSRLDPERGRPAAITFREADAMNPNLTTSFDALQIDRQRLSAESARGWRTDEAASLHQREPVVRAMRRTAGVLLVTIGERLQGLPAAPRMTNPAPALERGHS